MSFCFTGITKVNQHHNPDEGRNIWNTNFENVGCAISSLTISANTGSTIVVSDDNNIEVLLSGASAPPIYAVSLSDNIILDSISSTTISADTYYIGSEPLTGITSGLTFTNLSPTPTSIGGISAGSTFSAQTMEEMWNTLLYPYQTPAFTSFNRTNLSATYEVGQTIIIGPQTFTWSTSNSSNVSANTISITQNITPITTLYGPSNNVGSTAITLSDTYSAGTSTTTTLYTISGVNTNGTPFSSTISRSWRHKRYWGTHPTFTLPDNTEILNADGAGVGVGNEFSTTRNQTRNGIDGGGDYLFFAWPTSFGNPTFVINGLPNTAWTKIGDTISFTNSQGFVHTYDVWISDTAQNSPIITFIIN
jgi:hypothetical protein